MDRASEMVVKSREICTMGFMFVSIRAAWCLSKGVGDLVSGDVVCVTL